jgi:hypothetical protein
MPDKQDFLKNKFTSLIKNIPADARPLWGKMSLQQMVEHFSDTVRIASGRTAIAEFITPAENIGKMQAFLMSEKPFKENTPNPLMPNVPPPVRHSNIQESIDELQQEIDHLFSRFNEEKEHVTRNPFFGDLDFEQNLHLLYKHALHHLRQFGVTVT